MFVTLNTTRNCNSGPPQPGSIELGNDRMTWRRSRQPSIKISVNSFTKSSYVSVANVNQSPNVGSQCLFLPGNDVVQNPVKRHCWPHAYSLVQTVGIGDTSLHVFKVIAICIVVRYKFDLNGRINLFDDYMSQIQNGYRLVTADVKNSAGG